LSSKLIFTIIFVSITACGVKSDLIPPNNSSLPVYEKKFLFIPMPNDSKAKIDADDNFRP